jgi:hypothetical protein
MRIFIYGMQSSGASLLTFLVGQIPRSIVIADLWISYLAPHLMSEEVIVLKATISDIPLEVHLDSYQPTMKILHLRHPADITASLEAKFYRDEGGSLETKLQTLDRTFHARDQFDLTVFYEDLISNPKEVLRQLRDAGIGLPPEAEKFHRKPTSIVSDARTSSEWCNLHYNNGWGLGNAHLDQCGDLISLSKLPAYPCRDDARIWSLVRENCPALLTHYAGLTNGLPDSPA